MISTSSVGQRIDFSTTSPCWLEIDLDLIVSNVLAVRRLLDPGTAVAAVVKANAYGLGATEVARAALAAGATVLAVARIQEGVALRRAGLNAPILNLAYTGPEEVEAAVEFGITPTIADVEVARALARAARGRPPVGVHLKVDTGLSRFGAQPDEVPAILSALADEPALCLEGLSSHFATADEPDPSYSEEQLRRFLAIVGQLAARGLRPRLRHMANSAATLALPAARLDLVRLGISLSGTSPLLSDTPPEGLRSAVALRARLARVYDLPAGASVGYGQSFTCRRPTRAGLVPVGYADGLPRAHSNRGAVLIGGRRAPLIGRVSMDQCVVDLTDLPAVRPGEEVTLIGRQGGAEISLTEFAAWSGTIPHEALCRIGPRVPRCYQAGRSYEETALGDGRGAARGNGHHP